MTEFIQETKESDKDARWEVITKLLTWVDSQQSNKEGRRTLIHHGRRDETTPQLENVGKVIFKAVDDGWLPTN